MNTAPAMAISAEGLGKRYRLGQERDCPRSA